MSKQRYDSDSDISDKLRKLMINSEKEAKQAVTKASKVYESNLRTNTPVHERQTHSTHAIEVIKVSNFQRDRFSPTKEIGFDKGRKRSDSGWYIHFPDIGTTINGSVGQPPQHFMRRTQEMSKAPILAIYKDAVRKMMDVD